MIVNENISIEICRGNIRYYKEKYQCSVGDIIDILVSDLPLGSSVKIKVRCKICSCEKNLSYRKYIKNITKCKYYSCSSKCSTDKKKIAYIRNLGTDHPLKNTDIINKIKNTCLEKYGVSNPMQNKDIYLKKEKTCLEKYGNVNYVASDNFKNDMQIKFGVSNPMQSIEINTNRTKTAYLINDFESIKYQGSYELNFLKHCKEHNIKIGKPIVPIDYYINDSFHRYFPDFYISKYNLLIEIKSTYYYNLHKNMNILKEKAAIENGYNYIVIIDKDYREFMTYIGSI